MIEKIQQKLNAGESISDIIDSLLKGKSQEGVREVIIELIAEGISFKMALKEVLSKETKVFAART